MLYVGLIQDGDRERLYVSPYSESDPEDLFSNNYVFIDFSGLKAKQGDPIAQRAELHMLRNVLVAGGAQVIIETV